MEDLDENSSTEEYEGYDCEETDEADQAVEEESTSKQDIKNTPVWE